MKMTKTLILAVLTSTILMSCKHEQKTVETAETTKMTSSITKKVDAYPEMTFAKTEYDFGTINEGDVVKHSFSFTNTGKAPLIIINAKGSCGCTVSDWPKEPIAPGESKELLVSFNSSGKPNMQSKQVTITTNTTTGKEILKIKAMVTPKAKNIAKNTSVAK